MESDTQNSLFLTRKEAAQLARCSSKTIQRWQDQGKLRRCGLGRPLVNRDELTRLLSGVDDVSDHRAA